MNRFENTKMKMGTVLFVLIAVLASSAAVYAKTVMVNVTTLENKEFTYTTDFKYSSSFTPNETSSVAPWILYKYVEAEGNYYVGSRYKQNSYSYTEMPSTKYFASMQADGRSTSAQTTKDKENQIYKRNKTIKYGC